VFSRPRLGVVLVESTDVGVKLAAVSPGSPAAKAGLLAGDRLLAINDNEIGRGSPDERLARAQALIGRPAEGETLDLRYRRGDRTEHVAVSAQRMPALMANEYMRGDADAMLRGLEPLVRLGSGPLFDIGPTHFFAPCSGEDDCHALFLSDALRWRSLRLAALDAQLGRYFGSDHGVLVLKANAPVIDPEQVMRALRGQAEGARVDVVLLRDKRRIKAQIETPAAARLPHFAPPAPPAPPEAMAPAAAPSAPPAPRAPAAPPTPQMNALPPPAPTPVAAPTPPVDPEPGAQTTPAPAPEGRRPGVIAGVLVAHQPS
jgi:hypothetical protein